MTVVFDLRSVEERETLRSKVHLDGKDQRLSRDSDDCQSVRDCLQVSTSFQLPFRCERFQLVRAVSEDPDAVQTEIVNEEKVPEVTGNSFRRRCVLYSFGLKKADSLRPYSP